MPALKGLAGRIEVKRAGKVVATLRVRRSGRFAVRVPQKPGRATYSVRFVPRKGTGLAASFVRAKVRRLA